MNTINSCLDDYIKVFTPHDATFIIEFLYNVENCQSFATLNHTIDSLKHIVEFDWCYFCVSRLGHDNQFLSDSITLSGIWPEEWLKRYMAKNYHLKDPIVHETFKTNGFTVLFWEAIQNRYPESKPFFAEATEFSMKINSISVGIKDIYNSSFGGVLSIVGTEINNRSVSLFKYITPYIYRATLKLRMKNKKCILSEQEKIFLSLFGCGIKRKLIAEEFNISLRRVGQVLEQAATKLDAHNTVHAFNEALTEGIIKPQ